jgi:hypothetical protein
MNQPRSVIAQSVSPAKQWDFVLLDATGQALRGDSDSNVHLWFAIEDRRSGLVWGRTLREQLDQADAEAAVAALRHCGWTDWSLASISESLTLVDYARFSPACHPLFSDMRPAWYRTGSPVVGLPRQTWGISFDFGITSIAAPNERGWVRPVRKSESKTPILNGGW